MRLRQTFAPKELRAHANPLASYPWEALVGQGLRHFRLRQTRERQRLDGLGRAETYGFSTFFSTVVENCPRRNRRDRKGFLKCPACSACSAFNRLAAQGRDSNTERDRRVVERPTRSLPLSATLRGPKRFGRMRVSRPRTDDDQDSEFRNQDPRRIKSFEKRDLTRPES